MTFFKKMIVVEIALGLILVLFSYSYVDLNLTLFNNKTTVDLIANLQKIAYYNRPFATLIYFIIDISMYMVFGLILLKIHTINLYFKNILSLVIFITLLLSVAYPFLSSDIFNYMFDAKIITNYHLSPYTHKALDFPGDDWIRFMRWTHRYSPYGPLWLIMSLGPSLLGFGKFILTLFSFKLFISLFHIINTILIYKILKIIRENQAILGAFFYAFNPLFLLEGVVNSHNDVVLCTLLLLPIYLLVYKKILNSHFSIFLGVFIKYIPILTLPSQILLLLKKINLDGYIFLNVAIITIFTIAISTIEISAPFISKGSTQVQFQPWYLFWTIPYFALIPSKKLLIVATFICLGASLRYLPYLYFGDWTHSGTVAFMQLVTILPGIFAAILAALFIKRRSNVK